MLALSCSSQYLMPVSPILAISCSSQYIMPVSAMLALSCSSQYLMPVASRDHSVSMSAVLSAISLPARLPHVTSETVHRVSQASSLEVLSPNHQGSYSYFPRPCTTPLATCQPVHYIQTVPSNAPCLR